MEDGEEKKSCYTRARHSHRDRSNSRAKNEVMAKFAKTLGNIASHCLCLQSPITMEHSHWPSPIEVSAGLYLEQFFHYVPYSMKYGR